jgi:hypothetical protein
VLEIQIREFDDKIDEETTKNELMNRCIIEEELAKRFTIVAQSGNYTDLQNSEVLDQSVSLGSLKTTLQEIGAVLGLGKEELVNFDCNLESSKDALQLLDEKISSVCSELSRNRKETNKREDTLISETIVDCLLDKMEKFQNCERILDQNLFRQEYYK